MARVKYGLRRRHQHRIGLYDQVMIKDNHLAALEGNMAEAIQRARENYPDLKIEAEADTIEQAKLPPRPVRISSRWITCRAMNCGRLSG